MEEKDNLKGYKRNKITLLISVIRYIIGLLFLLVGIVASLFSGEILPGVFSILIGVISTPVIADSIEKKMNVSVSLSLRFFIILCLFFAIGATVDPVDPPLDSGAESNIAAAPQQGEISSIASYQDEKWLVAAGRNAPFVADDMSNIAKAADTSDLMLFYPD